MLGAQIGNYRITGKLGEGGMGAVYLAEHVVIGRVVAIKLLHPHLSVDPSVVQRFVNEARAAAAIDHPSLVEVHDFGVHDGAAYLVMEYLRGETLAGRLARGPISRDEALFIVRSVAVAVGAAHAKGIVHRDLKPDNVFLTSGTASVKVLDFGIAKLAREAGGAGLTRVGSIMGTPAYMSPEQCRGAGLVDERSDVYSLGCILHELLTGAPPFTGEGAGEIMAAHLREAPRSARSYDPTLPIELEAFLLRLLAKAPAERPRSMAGLVTELDRLAAAEVDTVVLPAYVPNDRLRTTTLGAAASETTRAHRRPIGILAALTACTAALAAAWLALAPPQVPLIVDWPTPTPTPTPTPPAPAPPVRAARASLPVPIVPSLEPVAPPALLELGWVIARTPLPVERAHRRARRPAATVEVKDGVYDPFGDP